jgi:hypothetical protein
VSAQDRRGLAPTRHDRARCVVSLDTASSGHGAVARSDTVPTRITRSISGRRASFSWLLLLLPPASASACVHGSRQVRDGQLHIIALAFNQKPYYYTIVNYTALLSGIHKPYTHGHGGAPLPKLPQGFSRNLSFFFLPN